MWIVVLLAIGVVVALWQVIVAGLIVWVLVTCIRWWIAAVTQAGPRSAHHRKPVQSRPEPRSKRLEPKPVRELPAPDYLPRWTASRRLDASREHAQWQIEFENTAQ